MNKTRLELDELRANIRKEKREKENRWFVELKEYLMKKKEEKVCGMTMKEK